MSKSVVEDKDQCFMKDILSIRYPFTNFPKIKENIKSKDFTQEQYLKALRSATTNIVRNCNEYTKRIDAELEAIDAR